MITEYVRGNVKDSRGHLTVRAKSVTKTEAVITFKNILYITKFNVDELLEHVEVPELLAPYIINRHSAKTFKLYSYSNNRDTFVLNNNIDVNYFTFDVYDDEEDALPSDFRELYEPIKNFLLDVNRKATSEIKRTYNKLIQIRNEKNILKRFYNVIRYKWLSHKTISKALSDKSIIAKMKTALSTEYLIEFENLMYDINAELNRLQKEVEDTEHGHVQASFQ
jgi:hypothetical protein